jgi:hypothetical protein
MAKRWKANGHHDIDSVSAEIRARARAAGNTAIDGLIELASGADSDSVKLAAIKELLDRGFGRAVQSDSTGAAIAHLLVDNGYED